MHASVEIGTPLSPHALRVLLLGAGELGKEVAIELQRYGVEVIAADRYADAPAMQVAHRSHVLDMLDGAAIRDLVARERPHLVVPEIEAIRTQTLVELEAEGAARVIPTARAAWLTMDREGIRRLAAETLQLPTSPYRFVDTLEDYRAAVAALGLPCVVKPVRQGSSIGMSIVRTLDQLPAALALALRHDGEVMVEAFLKGRELTAGVLGNSELTALPLIEIIPDSRYDFFNYEAKYQPGATREVCPAPVSETVRARAQDYALRAHRSLQLRGYSRTDMILVEEELYLLETNTIPGMTPTSLLPQAAAEAGLPFGALLDRLIELALERPAGPQG